MANAPLAETMIFQGVIYLAGITDYPQELADAIEEKRRAKKDNTIDGIFFKKPDEVVIPTPEPIPTLSLNEDTETPVVTDELPEDFPYRDLFVDAGHTTLDSVQALARSEMLTGVSGIGQARAEEVTTWLQDNVADEDEA